MEMLIPLWIKIVYTGFVCVLVVVYWRDYGLTNFLYFCDLALLVTFVALWLESPLLTSAATVGILIPEAFWLADFLARLFGFRISGMTEYLFDPRIPLFTRCLSLFHLWLPFLVLWILSRTGYDPWGLVLWTGIAWVDLPVSYFFMPAPPAPRNDPKRPVNINYVYGFGNDKPQNWMPSTWYFLLMMIGLPVAVFLPTHLLLRSLFPASTF
jgi:hypothetical protein